jgi:hypothetical protein
VLPHVSHLSRAVAGRASIHTSGRGALISSADHRSETAELKRATEASEQAWKAWKDAKAAGRSNEEVAQLKEKAESAMEYEKSLQDLCD